MSQHIYVIEDDENIRDLVKIALESYSNQVSAFETAEEALDLIQKDRPDLAVFDIMLPGMSGLDAVKIIRNTVGIHRLPIIMLTAKDSELDKVMGLDFGADDYMTKPFGILELSARIRSLLRRSGENEEKEKKTENICLSDITLSVVTREVYQGKRQIDLTYKEFELLKYLMLNHQKVVPRDELLNHIWGYDFIGETRTLDMHIRSLRQKLADENGKYIKTVRGVGYRFNAE